MTMLSVISLAGRCSARTIPLQIFHAGESVLRTKCRPPFGGRSPVGRNTGFSPRVGNVRLSL
jgi:hypothetical protein